MGMRDSDMKGVYDVYETSLSVLKQMRARLYRNDVYQLNGKTWEKRCTIEDIIYDTIRKSDIAVIPVFIGTGCVQVVSHWIKHHVRLFVPDEVFCFLCVVTQERLWHLPLEIRKHILKHIEYAPTEWSV